MKALYVIYPSSSRVLAQVTRTWDESKLLCAGGRHTHIGGGVAQFKNNNNNATKTTQTAIHPFLIAECNVKDRIIWLSNCASIFFGLMSVVIGFNILENLMVV